MASGPITAWQIDGETMETVTHSIFGGSKITADGDCCHEMKRALPLGRKAMTNLVKSGSHSVLSNSFVTPWTIKSMELSRPEHWSGQPFPSPGDLPNPGIKPRSPALHSLPGGFRTGLRRIQKRLKVLINFSQQLSLISSSIILANRCIKAVQQSKKKSCCYFKNTWNYAT